jgi:predicted peptidase
MVQGEQTAQLTERDMVVRVKTKYLLYLPGKYKQSGKNWPLMLFLHGAGERGNDLEKVKLHGPPKLIAKGKKFPFLVVSPQCPENQWWSSEKLDLLLQEITDKYNIDENRVYVTGLSMGGFGTWDLAIKYPKRFAAIAPICGGGDSSKVAVLKDLPIWVFHGAKDSIVKIEQSQRMVDALKASGSEVKFTIYPETTHDSWTETYKNPELYKWLLKQVRK